MTNGIDMDIDMKPTTEVKGDRRIEKSESVHAVMDYFSGIITRQD